MIKTLLQKYSSKVHKVEPMSQESARTVADGDKTQASEFANSPRNSWKSLQLGETSGNLPSEELGPLVDAGLGVEEGLPREEFGPLADELVEQLKEEEAQANSERLIHKRDYKSAIDGIMSDMMLGEDVNPISDSEYKVPKVPLLEDILEVQPGLMDSMDAVVSRYLHLEARDQSLLAEIKSSLASGNLSVRESTAQQDYADALERNLLLIRNELKAARKYLSEGITAEKAELAEHRAVERRERAQRRSNYR